MNKRRADANDAIVGQQIRAHRLARRLSQSELASRIGVSFQQVQKYEKGTNRVGSGRLVRVADALGVPVTALLLGTSSTMSAPEPSPVALIAAAHPLRLVQAFATIEDKGVRRALMSLTEGIARMSGKEKAAAAPAKPRRRAAG